MNLTWSAKINVPECVVHHTLQQDPLEALPPIKMIGRVFSWNQDANIGIYCIYNLGDSPFIPEALDNHP